MIQKSVSAGDNAYDIVMPAFGDCGSLAASGYFIDMHDLDYVDFSKIGGISVRSKTFDNEAALLCRFRYIISNNDATWCTMFNKEMIKSYGVPSPYDLVAENKWTYDNYYSTYSNIYQDLDGDGKQSAYDCYANLTQNENFNAMYLGSGERLISRMRTMYRRSLRQLRENCRHY